MSNSYITKHMKNLALDMLDRDENISVAGILQEAARIICEQERELSLLNVKYDDVCRHYNRLFLELDGIVKFLQEPYKMGVAPTVSNVGSEVRLRLEAASKAV